SDLAEPSQVLDRSIRVQDHTRDVASRKGKVRSVGEVEGLEAELKLVPLFDREFAGHGKVHVHDARPAQGVKSEIAKALPRDRLESQGVEVPVDIAEDLHIGFDQVGALRGSRHTQLIRGGYEEWQAGHE